MLELQDLFFAAIFAAMIWYWLKARELKELAYQAVKRHCEKVSVELLDDSLVLKSLSFSKNSLGRRQFQRKFQFEFSTTGEYRYTGIATLAGKHITDIELSTHQI